MFKYLLMFLIAGMLVIAGCDNPASDTVQTDEVAMENDMLLVEYVIHFKNIPTPQRGYAMRIEYDGEWLHIQDTWGCGESVEVRFIDCYFIYPKYY